MSTADTTIRRFPSPFDVAPPPGAEDWASMYPPYLLFSEENREVEEGCFWFLDSLHRPEVEYPFDTIVHEAWVISANAFAKRVFLLPSSDGFVNRVLNGRLYQTALLVSDPAEIQRRVPIFTPRAGFYMENWADLFTRWKAKMEACIEELKRVRVPELPDVEPDAMVYAARGVTTAHELLAAYNRVVENVFLAYQYHFEMHLCGYGAYLNLFQFCQSAFPGIGPQTIANMVAGSEIMMFRPGDELKSLARRALELGIADRLRADRHPEAIMEDLRADPSGREWVAALEAAQDTWFHFSNGTGLYHHERSWIDDLAKPWASMLAELDRLERGEDVQRPRAAILEQRERLAREYRELLPTDDDRRVFDENVTLARTVAAYVEDHNFYIENWHHTIFWNTMRRFGERLVTGGLLEDADDLFYLNRWDVGQALYDLTLGWSHGGPTRSAYWRDKVARHKRMLAAIQEWTPEPALGPVPADINEPFTVMLWGITPERIEQWLAPDQEGVLRGVAGSPGVAEGPARVILSVDQLGEVEEGEILVCPVTAPTWGVVFTRIKAAVVDTGGIMSHAAIVCREYGLPAVVGTVRGTHRLKTGDRIRVDGGAGTVSVVPR